MSVPNPAFVEELIKRVNTSPFPAHMAMQLKEIGFDHAVVGLQTDAFHLQPYGIVHGGVLATLVDTATFWAAFLRLPDGDGLVNIDLKLNYLKPVVNDPLRAIGRCIRSGRSLSYAEARVTDSSGQLVAHGTSTLMAMPDKGLAFSVPKFLEG